MYLDSNQIKDYLRSVHSHFTEHRDNESKLYHSVPFQTDPHVHLLVFTGINNKFTKTSFLEVRLYDVGQEVFFGRRNIIKLENGWEKKVKKGGVLAGHDYDNTNHKGVRMAADEVLGKENIIEKGGCYYYEKS